MKVKLVKNILEANDRIAEENKKIFDENGIFVINVMSAPGAGKTTLLEKTIHAIKDKIAIGVIEGDIATTRDAERIEATGAPVVQINTDGACHLDGNMIRGVIDDLPLSELDLLIIENVGNLVCPAEFKVGENAKVMLLSVTEGDDKPLKYPLMFSEASVLLISKIDLLPHTDFNIAKVKKESLSLNPGLDIIELSAKTGHGMEEWYGWLQERVIMPALQD
ncbi:MAG: hydrogenase accessory protein HypB [Deltaproteobacteria bacterium GWC2_42_51]|nr:MAG: hydrogenase accessory protein HypB [Deltaproteobacteria bacterium GWB2_42_7]OGP36605.1 MAG: hydrogenase accessory protein HypB [Deltaproteobacteria bacterium GWC2_42_51]OGP40256.1 MAG: hydrogenase accessory protein HypB [Deltaproteobacteria bacterium GWD2_42_10]OGP47066.1 MAG: hydrogenase accessory protein HypB [Deltaproteobacteria bacterium GWF2_42_12]OGQ26947.1 MAG: hydrogenase accessory protein HypB [Deltaproteobacteria bacterium RIFCSPHIGHO2_02_FULL_42_44]OGQ36332.1 MAG: hydrogenas